MSIHVGKSIKINLIILLCSFQFMALLTISVSLPKITLQSVNIFKISTQAVTLSR